jgi:hypothetical protein
MKPKHIKIAAVCLALTLGSGVLRGRMDYRWGPSSEMLAAAGRVAELPVQIGAWQAVRREHLDEQAVAMLRCTGNILRVYMHEPTGRQVSLALMVGPAGPLAVHTPEVCYRSTNYREQESRRRTRIVDRAGGRHDFFVTTFRENRAGERLLRVYYAWNLNQEWVAPAGARTAFAGVSMLYKIQAATFVGEGDEPEADAARDFLEDALLEIQAAFKT